MKYFLACLIILSFFPGASGKEAWKKEEQFWTELARLNEVMFNRTDEVIKQLKLTNEIYQATEEKSTTMFGALFESTMRFHEYHSPNKTLKNYIEENISKIPDSNSFKHLYLSQLAILQFASGELKKFRANLDHLKQNNAFTFAATVELMTSPNELNYENLLSHCTDICNFYIYHQSVANYFLELGHYNLLEEFASEMVNDFYSISKENTDIRSFTFLGYLYLAKKCQFQDIDSLSNLNKSLTNDINHLEGFSNKFANLLASECK